MKLELKHLAPYLPYKLQCITSKASYAKPIKGELTMVETDSDIQNVCIVPEYGGYALCEINSTLKPILRPLSDLTKEIEIGGEIYIGRDEFSEVEWNYYQEWEDILHLDYASVLQLIKRHFDVFGLIEVGLAISYSELNNKTDINNEIEDTTSQMNKSFNTSKDV